MNNGTDNQNILGNCPACHKLMQVPVVTDVASIAKCPHCQEKISVRNLLASIVPQAEIVTEDEPAAAGYVADRQRVYDDDEPKSREKFEVPKQLYEGASRRFRKGRGRSRRSSRGSSSQSRSERNGSSRNGKSERSERSSRSAEVSAKQTGPAETSPRRSSPEQPSDKQPSAKQPRPIESTPAPAVTSATTSTNGSQNVNGVSAAPSSPQERRQPVAETRPVGAPRRRTSDMEDEPELGIFDIVKFLIGGLIAAPLAYLALLWVLGVDPFGMAGTFEGISPSLIPASLHSENVSEETQPGFAPPSTTDSPSELFGNTLGDSEGLPQPTLDPDMVR